MAPTPEQAGKQAYDAAMEAGVFQVSAMLKTQFKNLTLLYPNLQVPDKGAEAEWRGMGEELIEKRRITAKDKSGNALIISLDDLDEKDKKEGRKLAKALGVKSLSDAVPTQEQLGAIAGATADGVAENVGSVKGATWGSTLSGFWNMIREKGFFAAIGAVFNLIFGDGKSENAMALQGHIAGATAENMRGSVEQNLVQLRAARPDLVPFLNNETIIRTADEVRDAVLVQANVKEAKTKPSLAQIEFATLGSNEIAAVRSEIRETILTARDSSGATIKENINTMLETTIKKKADAAWVPSGMARWWGAHNKEEVAAASGIAAEIVADKVSTIVSDPAYRTADGKRLAELSREEFSKVMGEEVVTDLLAKKDLLHIPNITNPLAKDEKAIDELKTVFGNKMAASYDQLNPVIVAIGEVQLKQAAQAYNSGAAKPEETAPDNGQLGVLPSQTRVAQNTERPTGRGPRG